MTCKMNRVHLPALKKVIFSPHARHNMGLTVPLLFFQAATPVASLKQTYIFRCKLKTKIIKMLKYFLKYFSNNTLHTINKVYTVVAI